MQAMFACHDGLCAGAYCMGHDSSVLSSQTYQIATLPLQPSACTLPFYDALPAAFLLPLHACKHAPAREVCMPQ